MHISKSYFKKNALPSELIFLSIFKEEPLSLFVIHAAAILNSAQWTVGIDDVAWLLAPISTSFPESLSPRPQEREKRDPGCDWSHDLGDKPKPQGGLFLNNCRLSIDKSSLSRPSLQRIFCHHPNSG